MKINLREMTKEELSKYQDFSYQNYLSETSKVSGNSVEKIKVEMQAKTNPLKVDKSHLENMWRIIECDGLAVGYIWVQLNSNDNSAFGYDIYIDEEYRSKGIGREVMLLGKDLLSSANVKELKINVFDTNLVARSLYDSLGFKFISTNSRGDAHEMVIGVD